MTEDDFERKHPREPGTGRFVEKPDSSPEDASSSELSGSAEELTKRSDVE